MAKQVAQDQVEQGSSQACPTERLVNAALRQKKTLTNIAKRNMPLRKRAGIAGLYAEVAPAIIKFPTSSKVIMSFDDTKCLSSTVVEISVKNHINSATLSLQNIFRGALNGSPVTTANMLPIVEDITQSQAVGKAMIFHLTRIKSKDSATFVHSIAVSALMMRMADHLGFDVPTTQIMGVGGLLHDIGKLFVPSDILQKEGALTPGEMRTMCKHPAMGHGFLGRQPGLPELVLDVCRHHHERVDGSGYPDRLTNSQISQYARIAAICDVFDALTSLRPYKKPWTVTDAIRWMFQSNGHFDRQLLVAFSECIRS
ncbi:MULTISPECIES: HD-GYP domain-containing protein [Rhizobium]|uniref:HD-GYP domain-containing protein n=1 Tax=Rhizobium rhododendri TaxID=2506430 RepID=A0ABY8ISP3_9HYPH|nr:MULTISPECIES: HD-GYP domain-containing protein [Rhizobium]TQX82132.1 HD-GYP domain-containing protein [Rhizobium sp. rho-13.1]TQY05522.1 HD-GYP domain-containing protein [Rhizobium sp. rho-1.1]WFS26020.1 HD-GYP domain-containing protein [Rhizobium rhododendri]